MEEAVVSVELKADGSAVVDNRWHWDPDNVKNAVLVSRVCRESRRAKRDDCDCTACAVARAVRERKKE